MIKRPVFESLENVRGAGLAGDDAGADADETIVVRAKPATDPEIVDARRSLLMGRVRQSGTKPEMAVRRAAHALGFRFRLQCRDLPGRPDLVFPRLRKALFVHGCFWHSHSGCKWATVPKTRTDYWDAKLAANRARDQRVEQALSEQGWRVGVVWECETRSLDIMLLRLRSFLEAEIGHEEKPTTKHQSPAIGTKNL